MNDRCDFPEAGDPRVCRRCAREVKGVASGPIYAACRTSPAVPRPATRCTAPSLGPGGALRKLIERVSFTKPTGCRCEDYASQMDAWGAEECRRRVGEIAGWLRESFGLLPPRDMIKVLRGVRSFVGDWRRPIQSLVEVAIDISEMANFRQCEISADEVAELPIETFRPLRTDSTGIIDALGEAPGGTILYWLDDGADLRQLPIEPIRGPGRSMYAQPGGGYLRRPLRPLPKPGKLIRIEQNAGLGDAVELSAVLRNVRHYYPLSRIELVVTPSRAALYSSTIADPTIGRPLVDEVLSEAKFVTHPLTAWPGHSRSFKDWPSTPAEHCLIDRFGLEPVPGLCHYWCPPASAEWFSAASRTALCHFAGRHRQPQKNLSEQQGAAVREAISAAGFNVRVLGEDVSAADAGQLAEQIASCDLFVGIDSGPLHVASALGKRAIGLWTYLSPVHCFCPDATTTHLLWRGPAEDYERWRICRPVEDGLAFFKANYRQAWCDDFGEGISRLLGRVYTPRQDVEALIALCERFGTKRLLEIGCNRGETTLALSERFPSMQIVGVDPGDAVAPADRAPTQLGEYLPPSRVGELVAGRPNVRIYRCGSIEFPVAGFAEDGFDAVFIDGDHRQATVEHDTRMARRLLRRPGFIAWHDCDNPELGVVHALAALGIAAQQVPGTWLAYHAF